MTVIRKLATQLENYPLELKRSSFGFLFGFDKQLKTKDKIGNAASVGHRPDGDGDIQGYLQHPHYFSSTSLRGA